MPVTYIPFHETPVTLENNNCVKCLGDIGCGRFYEDAMICIDMHLLEK